MDITVRRTGDHEWSLEDLLGRSMGRIVEEPPERFSIAFEAPAMETTFRSKGRYYPTLDAALHEIETQTRGVCLMGVDEPRA